MKSPNFVASEFRLTIQFDSVVRLGSAMIGRRILHYEIVEMLGRGGMGVVYKARDTHLDRFVAIKVLPPEKVADAGRKRRFVQEAKAASSLNHPNIIHIYDIADADGIHFIVMEYVAGKALDQIIGRKGLRLNQALQYSVQIADALAKAHSAHIIHRDLKPSNVMITSGGLVKVLDFGLAKLIEHISSEHDDTATMKGDEGPDTAEGVIVGTVAYMSPEQAEGRPVGPQSDIFSFGSLLYEIITGRRAFQGDSKVATLSAVLKEDPKPVCAVVPDAPRDLDKIVARCLKKQPERRFQHMDDVKVALAELKEEADSGVLDAAAPRREKPSNRVTRVGGSILFLGALAAGIWLIRFRPSAPEAPLIPVPVTSEAAFEAYPTFSPDGNQIAYSSGSDNESIYVKIIGVPGPPRRLTTQLGNDQSPAWSPDGRYITFLRKEARNDTRAMVLRIPLTGGPEQTLAEVLLPRDRHFGPRLTWFPDGRWLIMDDCRGGMEQCGLSALSVDTREKRSLTTPAPGSGNDDGPAVSPDGRWLAFSRGDGETSELYVLELSGDLQPKGEPKQVTFEKEAHDSPVWMPDGRELIFTSGMWEAATLARMAVSQGHAGKPQRLALGDKFVNWPAVSPQGRRLVYSRNQNARWEIWKIGISPTTGKITRPVKLIWSTQADEDPNYSPDGKRIAFKSSRSGRQEIWVCDSDGSNAIQLTSSVGSAPRGPHWSPDGRSILFTSNISGRPELFIVNSQGGTPNRVMASTTAASLSPVTESFSRDGKWIYFDSDRSGGPQIWKRPADAKRTSEKAVQLTRRGGHGGIESPDGKRHCQVERKYAHRLKVADCHSVILGPKKRASRPITPTRSFPSNAPILPQLDNAGAEDASGRRTIVVVQHPTQPFAAADDA